MLQGLTRLGPAATHRLLREFVGKLFLGDGDGTKWLLCSPTIAKTLCALIILISLGNLEKHVTFILIALETEFNFLGVGVACGSNLPYTLVVLLGFAAGHLATSLTLLRSAI